MFSHCDFEKKMSLILSYLKMNKASSINSNSNDETVFKLNKIKKSEYYFNIEIKEREAMEKD